MRFACEPQLTSNAMAPRSVNAPDGPCRILPWDSAFFGLCIARVPDGPLTERQASDILRWCVDNAVDCLYFLATPTDAETTHVAERHGFSLVDVRVTLERDAVEVRRGAVSEVRPASADDLESLRQIATTSHTDSRFYFDHRFPRERCDALYALWIEQSCAGAAGVTLVVDNGKGPTAYLTCDLDGQVGQIGLMAVAAEARGRGVGRVLVEAGVSWCAERGANRMRVVTQGRNISAQALYQRCGFTTAGVGLWYHRWFDHAGVSGRD